MCGIFAMISKKNLPIYKFLLNGLKQLQNRGYDSAGVCTVSENSFEVIKYASENINAISKIEQQINMEELSTLMRMVLLGGFMLIVQIMEMFIGLVGQEFYLPKKTFK